MNTFPPFIPQKPSCDCEIIKPNQPSGPAEPPEPPMPVKTVRLGIGIEVENASPGGSRFAIGAIVAIAIVTIAVVASAWFGLELKWPEGFSLNSCGD